MRCRRVCMYVHGYMEEKGYSNNWMCTLNDMYRLLGGQGNLTSELG